MLYCMYIHSGRCLVRIMYAQETQYPGCCFVNNVRAERNH